MPVISSMNSSALVARYPIACSEPWRTFKALWKEKKFLRRDNNPTRNSKRFLSQHHHHHHHRRQHHHHQNHHHLTPTGSRLSFAHSLNLQSRMSFTRSYAIINYTKPTMRSISQCSRNWFVCRRPPSPCHGKNKKIVDNYNLRKSIFLDSFDIPRAERAERETERERERKWFNRRGRSWQFH